MPEQLEVQIRTETGKRRNKRLRARGIIPAVLYGHGQDTVSLQVSADQLELVLKQGAKMLALKGAVEESALVRELQWDTFGVDVLHVDFTRVSADEVIEVTVAIELRGEAPGAKAGGVVDHQVHQLVVQCSASNIPGNLQLNINSLGLDESIKVSDIELPQGCTLVSSPDSIVVQCIESVELDEEGTSATGAEPEVIGRKEDDEEKADEK